MLCGCISSSARRDVVQRHQYALDRKLPSCLRTCERCWSEPTTGLAIKNHLKETRFRGCWCESAADGSWKSLMRRKEADEEPLLSRTVHSLSPARTSCEREAWSKKLPETDGLPGTMMPLTWYTHYLDIYSQNYAQERIRTLRFESATARNIPRIKKFPWSPFQHVATVEEKPGV